MLSCLSVRLASAVTAAALVTTLAAPRAHAQAPLPPSQPPTQPPPASAQAPNGEYVAPLQQQTQQIYVPQSVALSGPRIIKDYEEGDPVPPGYHAESRVRTGLVVGGAVTFGSFYLLSVMAAAIISDANKMSYSSSSSRDNADFLYAPCAGPFLQMTKTDSSTGNMTLAIDGLAQTAGAVMLVVGLTSPKTVLVRNDLGTLRVTPMQMGRGGTGLGLVGTF